MKTIYLNPFAGISGNMFLGALLDAGFPFEVLEQELKKLNLGKYELVYRQVNKLGIEAKYFNVLLPEEHEHSHAGHEHEKGHEQSLEHAHEHAHGGHSEHHHAAEEIKGEALRSSQPQPQVKEYSLEGIQEFNEAACIYDAEGNCLIHDHGHGEHAHHEGEHAHEHSLEGIQEHNDTCVFDAEGNCLVHNHSKEQGHHDHNHAQPHSHEGEHSHAFEHEYTHGELPHAHHHHEHRNLKDVMNIINNSGLSQSIKTKAEAVFTAIAKAEGKVHGKPLDEVHFHEVGAIDTIIDIVGTLLGLEYLGIEKIYCGRINTGFGYVKCAHGIMPVPAPATAELLQGLPVERGIVDKEMTTPTGAALVKVLAEMSVEQPQNFVSTKLAYGAGTREVQIPNVLQMYVGESEKVAGKQVIIEAACNIDDMTGEVLGYAMEKILVAGALDCWAEPIYMKKGRPAYKLCFICAEANLQDILKVLFKETTTLGVRYNKVERAELARKYVEVTLPEGRVKVKCGEYQGEIVNIAPEFEDCKALAAASGKALQSIMDAAKAAVKQ